MLPRLCYESIPLLVSIHLPIMMQYNAIGTKYFNTLCWLWCLTSSFTCFFPLYLPTCAFLHILLSFNTFYTYSSFFSTSLNFSQSILKLSSLGMPVCHYSSATPSLVVIWSQSFPHTLLRKLHDLFTPSVASIWVLNRPILLGGCGDIRASMGFGQLNIDQVISQNLSIIVGQYFYQW